MREKEIKTVQANGIRNKKESSFMIISSTSWITNTITQQYETFDSFYMWKVPL